MQINDDVAIIDLINRRRTLGVIQNIVDNITIVTESGTGETIEFMFDNYQKALGVPVEKFRMIENPTEFEIKELQKKRLIQQLNTQWIEYINGDPSLENVRALAELLKSFNT